MQTTRTALAAVLAAAALGAPAMAQTYGSQGYGTQGYGNQGYGSQGATTGYGQGYDRSAYPPSTYDRSSQNGYGQGSYGQNGYPPSRYDQGDGGANGGQPSDDPQMLARQLNLTPSQRSAFNAYQNAFRPDQARAQQEEAEMNRMASLTTPQRLDLARQSMQRDTADFNRTDAATRAFYSQLSPSQQRTFDRLTAPQMDDEGGPGGPSPTQPAAGPR